MSIISQHLTKMGTYLCDEVKETLAASVATNNGGILLNVMWDVVHFSGGICRVIQVERGERQKKGPPGSKERAARFTSSMYAGL